MFNNRLTNIVLRVIIALALVFIASYLGLFAFAVALLLGLIVWIFSTSVEGYQYAKVEKRMPITKIAFLSEGLVEIRGICKILDPTFSKISNTACVANSYKVERVSLLSSPSAAKARTKYSTVSYEEFCNPFLVEDDTGSVRIEPLHLEILSFYHQKKVRKRKNLPLSI